MKLTSWKKICTAKEERKTYRCSIPNQYHTAEVEVAESFYVSTVNVSKLQNKINIISDGLGTIFFALSNYGLNMLKPE
jgi:hypothetical protein